MRILSVNVGLPAELTHGGRTVLTGIVKEPVGGRVAAGPTGLAGDGQADLTVHGGEDKAVYAYPLEHYAHWEVALGRDDLSPGRFGENLTVEGVTEDEVGIGDLLRTGDTLFEVSQPRIPCFKLGMRMGDPGFLKPFLRSGRVGFYLRVIEPGTVGAGDDLVRERTAEGSMTVREVAALLLDDARPDDLDRGAALGALPLSWREGFASRAVTLRRRAG
ncbi:MAG: MOSC domain-containing protein [Thermoleophilia bacterium]